jgi:hypothetical protein
MMDGLRAAVSEQRLANFAAAFLSKYRAKG